MHLSQPADGMPYVLPAALCRIRSTSDLFFPAAAPSVRYALTFFGTGPAGCGVCPERVLMQVGAAVCCQVAGLCTGGANDFDCLAIFG